MESFKPVGLSIKITKKELADKKMGLHIKGS
jgi:hypothetical protein